MEGNEAMTPKQIIDDGRMHPLQWAAIALTIFLNALDGFDVLSSAFAGPGISKDWDLSPGALGIVQSMELIGMGVGSLFLGGIADKRGRRFTIFACLSLMATGMFMASTATGPQSLSIWRFVTGIGIGGMLAAINAVANEYSNKRFRSFCMAAMVVGYPLGGFFGGMVVKYLLPPDSWRAIFEFGAWTTLTCLPLVWLLIPETPAFLNARRPADALDRINKTLSRFALPTLGALPPLLPAQTKASLADIFKPAYLRTTMLLSFGYTFHALTFYYILKMVPNIMADPKFVGLHFTRPEAAGVLSYANLGGALGGLIFGWFMHRFGIKRAAQFALALSVLMIGYFGIGRETLGGWSWAVFAVGLFTNASIVGFYSSWALVYPAHIRATGTGFALTIGRGGAALSPILAGQLFSAHLSLLTVSLIMSAGSLLALLLFSMLDLKDGDAAASA
jgi:MFS family permease